MLEWADEDAGDESALDRLDAGGLRLVEEDRPKHGYDPYDSGAFKMKGSAFYERSHGKRSAFARGRRGS